MDKPFVQAHSQQGSPDIWPKLTANTRIARITVSPVFDVFIIYFVFSDINFQLTSVS
jgi:hypothetical protein